MTVIERIEQIAKKYGGVEKFAEKCGLNPGSLRNAIQRGSDVKSNTIESIVLEIPTLNLRWLLLGKGEPFLEKGKEEEGDLSGQQFKEDAAPYIAKLNDLLEKRVNELERELKKTDPQRAKDLGID